MTRVQLRSQHQQSDPPPPLSLKVANSLTFADRIALDLFQLLRSSSDVVYCVEDELQRAFVLQHVPCYPRQVEQVLPLWGDVVNLHVEREESLCTMDIQWNLLIIIKGHLRTEGFVPHSEVVFYWEVL